MSHDNVVEMTLICLYFGANNYGFNTLSSVYIEN